MKVTFFINLRIKNLRELLGKVTDTGMEIHLSSTIFFILRRMNMNPEAQKLFEEAEGLFEDKKFAEAARIYSLSIAECPSLPAYLNLGNSYFSLSQLDEAEEAFFYGLELARDEKDRWFEGTFLGNLGFVESARNAPQAALEYYLDALAIFRETGHIKDEADQLCSIGTVHQDLGEMEYAIKYFGEALLNYKQAGYKKGVASQLNNMGLILARMNRSSQAEGYFAKALEIFKELGDQTAIAAQLMNIGSTYRDRQESEKALKYYDESMALYGELGDIWGMAMQYSNIAYLHAMDGDNKIALEYFRKSKELFSKIGTPDWQMEFLDQNIKKLIELLQK